MWLQNIQKDTFDLIIFDWTVLARKLKDLFKCLQLSSGKVEIKTSLGWNLSTLRQMLHTCLAWLHHSLLFFLQF
jgi:hypothetical protein